MAKKTKKKVNKESKKLAFLLAVVLVLGGLFYLFSQTQAPSRNENKPSAIQIEKDGTVLDCSKKIAQGDSTIAQGAIEKSKCLFLGCGDFF